MRSAPTRTVRSAAAVLAVLAVAACGESKPAAPGTSGAADAPPAGKPPVEGPAAPAPAAPAPDRAALLAAYDRGLDYLLSQQKDGKWEMMGQSDVGFTALAVTSFFERPGGMRESDRKVADAAVDFVVASLTPGSGVVGNYANYTTCVAIQAMVASGRKDLRPQIDGAVSFIRKFQFLDENDPSFGGIGYGSDKTRSDLSNTQYALASLRAAGIGPEDPAFQRALTYLTRVQNRKENETPLEPTEWKDPKTGKILVRSNDGGANYIPGDSKAGYDERPDGVGVLRSYGSMTYALLRCYHLAGLDAKDGRVDAAVKWVSRNWTLERNPGMPEEQRGNGLYYYYATIGKTLPLAKLDTLAGPEGKPIDWRADLGRHLLAAQQPDGSWTNPDPRWMESLPVLPTSYALQALAACVK